jgi:TetR/AcrR family transcriptional regulator, cholesterol catabolism regulator
VIEMVDQVGPEHLQMRDVAERSGVALGTAYRYFSSKDHLLAAAWAEWHRRLTDRVRADVGRENARQPAGGGGAASRVVAFIHRELRAFQRHPNFARLVAMVEASPDPFASEELAALGADNTATIAALLDGVPPHVMRPAMTAINATLAIGLANWTTGRLTIADVFRQTEEVTRLVLGPYDAPAPTPAAVPAGSVGAGD